MQTKTQEQINQEYTDMMNLAMENQIKNFGYDVPVTFSAKYNAIKIYKGDEYKFTREILMNFISTTGINFFKDFDVEIKRFSDDEWIIKILNDNDD